MSNLKTPKRKLLKRAVPTIACPVLMAVRYNDYDEYGDHTPCGYVCVVNPAEKSFIEFIRTCFRQAEKAYAHAPKVNEVVFVMNRSSSAELHGPVIYTHLTEEQAADLVRGGIVVADPISANSKICGESFLHIKRRPTVGLEASFSFDLWSGRVYTRFFDLEFLEKSATAAHKLLAKFKRDEDVFEE